MVSVMKRFVAIAFAAAQVATGIQSDMIDMDPANDSSNSIKFWQVLKFVTFRCVYACRKTKPPQDEINNLVAMIDLGHKRGINFQRMCSIMIPIVKKDAFREKLHNKLTGNSTASLITLQDFEKVCTEMAYNVHDAVVMGEKSNALWCFGGMKLRVDRLVDWMIKQGSADSPLGIWVKGVVGKGVKQYQLNKLLKAI